jgi:hypothetical protein
VIVVGSVSGTWWLGTLLLGVVGEVGDLLRVEVESESESDVLVYCGSRETPSPLLGKEDVFWMGLRLVERW